MSETETIDIFVVRKNDRYWKFMRDVFSFRVEGATIFVNHKETGEVHLAVNGEWSVYVTQEG